MHRKKNIYINISNIDYSKPNAGVRRYCLEVTKGLFSLNQDLLKWQGGVPFQYIENKRNILYREDFYGHISRLLINQTILPMNMIGRADIFYSPLHEGMLFPVCKQIITVFDVLPLVYPKTYPRLYYYFKHILPILLKRSSKVITISEYTKQELVSIFKVPEDKIEVLYLGYNKEVFYPRDLKETERVKRKYGLDRFILFLGEMREYKNVIGLIKATKLVNAKVQLVLAGKMENNEKAIKQAIDEEKLNHRVKLLGFVSDKDLSRLYSSAEVFVLPSKYEGFGIPVLEAMACGCPVAVSRTTALPEVVNDAGEYFNPYNPKDIAHTIQKLLDHKTMQKELKQKSLIRANNFSYEKTAQGILSLLEKV